MIDSSPLTINGIKITNVEGEGCGTCNIAEALKRSLNTGYYRLMLKLKNGPQDVADAAHRAGIAESFPGSTTRCPRTAKAARPTTESCWASTRVGSSIWRRRTRRSPIPGCTRARISCRRLSTPTVRSSSTRALRSQRRTAHR